SGLAGAFTVIRVSAAAAREGLPLDQVKAVAAKANENMSSLSATLELGANPATGLKMGEIKDGEVHYGMGVTGEPGVQIGTDCSASAISTRLVEALAMDLGLSAGDEVAVSVNGGGCVTVLEELLICGHVCSFFQDRRITIFDVDVQERVKVERTNSICVTVMKLDDDLKRYLCVPVASPLVSSHRF
ncbi:MAG: dihydroxyacetone kinase subunit DhaK, partial [Clostridia bacterium]|nr:dihydroxyacetone kinase subunit DhaK [Clostridia bacterium]